MSITKGYFVQIDDNGISTSASMKKYDTYREMVDDRDPGAYAIVDDVSADPQFNGVTYTGPVFYVRNNDGWGLMYKTNEDVAHDNIALNVLSNKTVITNTSNTNLVIDVQHDTYTIKPTVNTTLNIDTSVIEQIGCGCEFKLVLDFTDDVFAITLPSNFSWNGEVPDLAQKGTYVIDVVSTFVGGSVKYVGQCINFVPKPLDTTKGLIVYVDDELSTDLSYGTEYVQNITFDSSSLPDVIDGHSDVKVYVREDASIGQLSSGQSFDDGDLYLTIEDGSVGYVEINRSCRFDMLGGMCTNLLMEGTSSATSGTISGGYIGTATHSENYGSLTITGSATIDYVYVWGMWCPTTTIISGGARIGAINSDEDAVIQILGGNIDVVNVGYEVYATMSAGYVGSVNVSNGAIDVDGGTIGSLSTESYGSIYMTGGYVDLVHLQTTSRFAMDGGTISALEVIDDDNYVHINSGTIENINSYGTASGLYIGSAERGRTSIKNLFTSGYCVTVYISNADIDTIRNNGNNNGEGISEVYAYDAAINTFIIGGSFYPEEDQIIFTSTVLVPRELEMSTLELLDTSFTPDDCLIDLGTVCLVQSTVKVSRAVQELATAGKITFDVDAGSQIIYLED